MTAPQAFPTRQYSYRRGPTLEAFDLPVGFEVVPGGIYRFHMGRDATPVRISPDDVRATLHDPFARLVLVRQRSANTLQELLAVVRDADVEADRLVRQRVFVVADGGQIPWTPETAALERTFRFVLVLSAAEGEPVVYVSTTPPFDSSQAFLQVIGWDPVNGAYQFYDRRGGAWAWAGSSWEALDPDCRGLGPFDSHINGSINMKELQVPWLHWHSMSAGIRDEVLAPADPLRADPIWKSRENAELLERDIVRPGISRWQDARFASCVKNGTLTRVPEFIRQVVGTSTVNIAASPVASRTITASQRVPLPLSFFLDAALMDDLGLDPGIAAVPTVSGAAYLHTLSKYDVHTTDGELRFPGDTHFAFPVPEPAFEDTLVLRSLLRTGVFSDKLAASLLMVDFPNPVFSPRRTALGTYAPETATSGAASDFPARFVGAIEKAAHDLPADSAEHEFLANWSLAANRWRPAFEARLAAYFAALAPRLEDPVQFEPLFELADSRRREFRRRPLHEFKLTTPVSNIPFDAPLLQLREDARVTTKT